ncbi:peptidase-C39 like family protein [Fibrobacter sp.]|uniref:peptidase-C39 like family protein n=1 Tax=Fibrobacter sp. TaxID=35828 RepID=UPI00388F47B9
MMDIKILSQPDDVTCGPTSLHAVYEHLGYKIPLKKLISEIEFLEEGGTLGVFLGIDALKRGFKVTIYSYNLKIFDPSWAKLKMPELREKLSQLRKVKTSPKLRKAIEAYIRFIDLGGTVATSDLRAAMFQKHFKEGVPVLCGLSATYLYQCKREFTDENDRAVFDDIHGDPCGHFVVTYGLDEKKQFLVADPDGTNPTSKGPYYKVDKFRFLHSILLGVMTYDGNVLVVEKEINNALKKS